MIQILKNRVSGKINRLSWLYPILGITGIALVFRLYNLGSQSLWFDETYTLFVARLPLNESWKFLVADGVHPPLFYWIEKIFLSFGESELIVRLPALIFGVLAIPALYLVGRNWVPEKQALFASALLAISPYHIWYSQEARMYSGLLFLAIVIMGLFHANIGRPSRGKRIAFVLSSSIAYLMHYFTLLLPLIQFIYLLIIFRQNPRKVREWTAMQAIAVLPLLGWIFVLSQRDGQFFGIGWIPESQWDDLLLTVINFTLGLPTRITIMYWFALAVIFIVILRALLMRWSSPATKAFICLWAFLPIFLVFLLSFRRPLYVDRFLIFCIPAILLLVSRGISHSDRKLVVSSSLIMITLFLFGWYNLFLSSGRAIKENWREAFTYLDTHASKDELVVLRVLQIAIPMRVYSTANLLVAALEVNRQVDSIDEITAGYPGIWLLYWNASADTHTVTQEVVFDPFAETDLPTAAWINGEVPYLSNRVDFPGVTIFHFIDHTILHLTR